VVTKWHGTVSEFVIMLNGTFFIATDGGWRLAGVALLLADFL
jgi:hypothetical protein